MGWRRSASNVYGVHELLSRLSSTECALAAGAGVVTDLLGRGHRADVNIGVSRRTAPARAAASPSHRTLALEVARNGVTANTLAIGLMGMPDPKISGGIGPLDPGRPNGNTPKTSQPRASGWRPTRRRG